MKKITLTILSAVLVLLIISCESDIDKVVMSSDPAEPTVSQLSFTGDFSMENADAPITFSWSAADFGFQSSTTYGVQVSSDGNFSDNVTTLFTTQELTGTATVNDINNILLSWQAPFGEAATMYYRVSASISSEVVIYSGTNSEDFTPFETLIDYPMIYVPGGYQGWSPGAENGRLYSYGFNSVYEGIIRLVDGDNATAEFKIAQYANWDVNWGGSLSQTDNDYSGNLVSGGDNLVVNAGVYTMSVDLNALTISLSKTDDWGIIGSAVPPYDWSVDVDMWYNGQRKQWEITADFEAGAFKFRANDDWVVNYGDVDGDGVLDTANDNNISLAEAGNYTIRFDPVELTYTVIKN